MRVRALVAMVLTLAFLASGCDGTEPLTTATVEITHGTATVRYVAEIAATPDQRRQGLMHRESLADDAGMLFLFPQKVALGFWMKNTLIPLDIAFIADGRIVDIRSMTPCRTERCPLTTPSAVYDSALEVNEGSFARAGITAGDRVALNDALPKVS